MVSFSITLREATSSSTPRFQAAGPWPPRHNRDMPKGTLLSLLRESGFRRDDIIAFLEGK
jgi:hypothetical protein